MSFLVALLLAAGSEPAVNAADPNSADPQVCRRFVETGSRLKSKRVCMTKSEWEAQRQADKQQIERTQVQHPLNGSGG